MHLGSVLSSRTAAALLALLALAYACSAAPSSPEWVTDVLVGRNTKGPYSLTWTNFDADSVSVVVSGRTLKNRADYRIDPTKGVVAFNSICAADTIVRVSYRTVPGKSQKAAGNLSIPITLDLFQRPQASLRFMGLYSQDDPKNPEAAKTVFGLGGDSKWANTKLSSMLLLSQRNVPTRARVGLWERAAVRFAGDTTLGALKIAGSYLHSGSDFAGEKEYGVGLGKNAAELAAVFAPAKSLQFAARLQESEDTAGKTKGSYSRLLEQSLAYIPLASTRISLVRSITESRTAAAGSDRTVEANIIKLEQGIGRKTSAEATFEDATVVAGGTTDEVRSRGLQFSSAALRNLTFRGRLAQRLSELHGEERAMEFAVSAKPTGKVAMDVGVSTLENRVVGQQTKTNVTVQANPVADLQVRASLAANTADDQESFQRDFSVSGKPTGFSKLTATFSQKGVNEWDDVAKGALLELNPWTHTQLSAGYRYIECGRSIMTIADYAAAVKPYDFFSLIGSFRDRESQGALVPDTGSVRLALSPSGYFALTGEYQSNPEDAKGVVQPYNTTTLGLSARIGSVALTSNFTENEEYELRRLSDERKFGIELPCFGRGRITSGLAIARLLGGSGLMTRTYSLGYSHAVGSDFTLSLTGYYAQRLRDHVPQPGEDEYNAEASLGLKF